MKNNNALKIDKKDNVVVAVVEIKNQQKCRYYDIDKKEISSIKCIDDIPVFHKIASEDIKEGEFILKYGQHIGVAASDIKTGQHVHTHNVLDHRENLKNRGISEI